MTDSKFIIVCCDGNGMNGLVPSQIGDATTGPQAAPTDAYPTNISRFARSLKRRSLNNKRQVVFYQTGLGSEAAFDQPSDIGSAPLNSLGITFASKIRDAYAFISQNYDSGDEIFLFGFSRGAYIVRKVSELINRIGLLSMQNIGQFFDIWMQVVNNQTFTLPSDTRYTTIKAIGVFDTVGSVNFQKINALDIKDTTFPSEVSVGLHALSFHESRADYLPVLWTVPEGGLKANQVLKQVWFSGDHADVGGGWARHELADISLAWMVGELNALVPNLSFDIDLVDSLDQVSPDPWGTSQPHRLDPPGFEGDNGIKNRRSAGLSTTSDLHSSLLTSPTIFTPQTVITMQTLFGDPTAYPPPMPLNFFEEACKAQWGKQGSRSSPWELRPKRHLASCA
ncbi:hypothetical protein DL96DRAFT_874263 [Flagelloscypha sp. PMI_526]|nr:hypothetical protein DL96DRAFT_874263 [Flagelloscypha sp. PMI_526]